MMKRRKRKLTIQQAAALLWDVGYEMTTTVVPYDLDAMTARYEIRDRSTGELRIVTSSQIADMV